MATINASLTLSSSDLLTSNLAFSVSSTLTKAGNSTGLALTSGLARTNFLSTDPASRSKIIYRADDAATGGANKVYLKNLSTSSAEFFTIYIDQEEMGRLYAGDFALFPWSATQGTLETFVVTATGTVAVGESWTFDGITTTSTSTAINTFAQQIDSEHYPNWTTSISTAAVTFTARQAGVNGVVTATDAINGDTLVESGDGNFTMPITSGAAGTRSEADIVLLPSVATTMDLEHMLFHQ
tara:strand:- start:19 stop:738 length:720 start_codon:yes stop_codon:yes gene_type:complete